MATSAVFRSDPRSYMRSLAFLWLAQHWMWLACPFLAAALWCLYDIRAVYVGLILVFILYPMALSFVWFNYAFSPQGRRAISPKTITYSGRGIDVEYLPIAEGVEPLKPQFIGWNDIKSVEQGAQHVVLRLGIRLDDRLEIPHHVFDNGSWTEFLGYLPLSVDDVLS